MSVVGLDGKIREGSSQRDRVLAVLKPLIARIEEGAIIVSDVFLIAEVSIPTLNNGLLHKISADSGISAEKAVCWLEIAKSEIIDVLRGKEQ